MKNAKAHILIVEDDQAILNGLSDVLVFNGYTVQQADDGGRGLDAILNNQFDLVLLVVRVGPVCRHGNRDGNVVGTSGQLSQFFF